MQVSGSMAIPALIVVIVVVLAVVGVAFVHRRR